MPKRANKESWEARLKYWAILMRNWVKGYPISQIIARAISYYTQLGEITYRDYSKSRYLITEPFDKNSPRHINILVEKTLTDIENGLRFRIVGYLQNYYDLSEMILGPNASGINVATLVEYGTTDRKAIELQEVGFSRDVARELIMRCRHLIFFSQDNELDNLDHVEILKINPDKIAGLIGPGGKVIRAIIDETGVSIDIEDDGTVSIFGKESENMKKALELVKRQTQSVELNTIYEGKVTKLMKFGAFVEVLPGKEGLLHISEISNKRVEKTEDALKEGQNVRVKVISMENEDKFNLSMKALKQ